MVLIYHRHKLSDPLLVCANSKQPLSLMMMKTTTTTVTAATPPPITEVRKFNTSPYLYGHIWFNSNSVNQDVVYGIPGYEAAEYGEQADNFRRNLLPRPSGLNTQRHWVWVHTEGSASWELTIVNTVSCHSPRPTWRANSVAPAADLYVLNNNTVYVFIFKFT
jgi:hypothetical protein